MFAQRPWRRDVLMVTLVGAGFLGGAVSHWIVTSLTNGMSEPVETSIVVGVLTLVGVLVTAGVNQVLGAGSEMRLRLHAALEAGKLLTADGAGSVSSG